MRIIFICGSLEPGRDGVGDYTRLLAGEVSKKGHQAAVIALNDYFVTKEKAEWQQSEEIGLQVFRIPAHMRASRRFKLAKNWIQGFNPAWLSLQYVPYSFHAKGLPYALNRQLANLRKGVLLHIMFHELWVGQSNIFCSNIYTTLQKMIIGQMQKTLKPEVTHTHLPNFYLKLKRLKFTPSPLPLFSNVPSSGNEEGSKANEVFRVGVFSQIDVNNSIINFLGSLQQMCQKNGKPLEVLLIGENERLKIFGAFLKKSSHYKGAVRATGFLNNKEVSAAVQSCCIGLTSIPVHALGKSGSVTAFLAHGIPVAAPCIHNGGSDNPFFSKKLCQSIITSSDLSLLNQAMVNALSCQKEIELSEIAKTFLMDLKSQELTKTSGERK